MIIIRSRSNKKHDDDERKTSLESNNKGGISWYTDKMDNSSSTTIIDNSRNVYIPFHLKCGLTAQCSLDVFEQCPTILDIIEEDAYNCLRVLPSSVHDLVRRTKIWINVSYVYGHCSQPKVLKHMNTHHYVQWLEWYVI